VYSSWEGAIIILAELDATRRTDMRSKIIFLSIGIFFAMLLTGCKGGQPICADADLVAPVLTGPENWARLDSLNPGLFWNYPDDTCSPQGYRINLTRGPAFAGDLGGSTTEQSTVWFPGEELQPGSEYAWSVQGLNGTTLGPASTENHFFTGPACPVGPLKTPHLLSPANNIVYSGDPEGPILMWDYPDTCMPDQFLIELGTGAGGFSSSSFVSSWSTNWRTGVVNDCKRYFWHVRASALGNGNDGTMSDWSEIYTYRVDLTGSCAPEQQGMVRGTIWQDQCALPDGSLPDPLPLGCVPAPSGGATANGSYDPGETGIEGVIVSLAWGACPSTTILRAVPTYSQGSFSFYWLAPGTYCVSVDASSLWNLPKLAPGNWTSPPIPGPLASREVVVGAGQDVKNTDFGWWYQFGNGWGDENASVYGKVWHDLCAMTPTSTPFPSHPLPLGCALDAWGVVHADGIRQEEEPGIAGVVVDIGLGDCPSEGLATAITDANGYYHFSDLPVGKYCLSIDPGNDPTNAAILLPGSWTVIPSGHEGMTFRAITLEQATTLAGQDFGWDYDNLPPVQMEQSPVYTLTVNANCRKGPDVLYEMVTTAEAGQAFPIAGRNAEDNWYLVQLSPNLRCWMANSVGVASGDLSALEVLAGPPLPIITPIVNCSAHKDIASCEADSACRWTLTAGPSTCIPK
jgi:hypothetical protein